MPINNQAGEAETPAYNVEPNFFIVGASKSGTTSLYHYLRQHPDVFMPDRKEPHFFSTDIERPLRMSEQQYFALFGAAGRRSRIGEASADYLHSRVACDAIWQRFPHAKIVITLRNPVDKIHSSHAYEVWLGREEIEDFEEALAREGEAKNGATYWSYLETGRYHGKVQRYVETFGRDHVHIILFEDMVRDPESTFKALCRFLEIREDVPVEFGRYNPAKKARSRKLARLSQPASVVVRQGKRLPKGLRRVLGNFRRGVRKWNTRFEERPDMGPELRRRLEGEFADDVAKLSTLLGRDLSSFWFATHEAETVPE